MPVTTSTFLASSLQYRVTPKEL
uniref:Uncharacterized protein n=1 Tax=Arundo donax TaxID=35708 RepID=A0A0A8ZP36_ARUDO